jgi:hypothetical protein
MGRGFAAASKMPVFLPYNIELPMRGRSMGTHSRRILRMSRLEKPKKL